ncbi:MAG: dipeptidase [Chloroflexota bacterium]|nr:dipeptidase [Chloroflexota bacterium]
MTTPTADGVTTAVEFLRGRDEENLAQLDEFLRIQSVSADPARRDQVRRAAEWVRDELARIGAEHAELHETPLHPIVTADWLHAGPDAPTVLVYCHYDVQPEDPIHEWVRPPFEPRLEDERLYARGAADDKGQLFMHLKVVEAYLRGGEGRLPVNLRFLFEGEEEIGSDHLDEFLERRSDLLDADVVVVSDTSMFAEGLPTLGYGMRGLAYLELRVSGPSQDLHSGQFGGAVANPALVLARILASLHDERGHVTVPGFYDAVRPLSDDERRSIGSLPHDDDAFRAMTAVPQLAGEEGFSTLERLWVRPTLDVNGIWGGYTGEGAKTIIPAWVAAKISCRLVPDQDHREIARLVEEHLRALAPPTVRVEITRLHGGAPSLTPLDHPAVRAAGRALEATFGQPPVFARGGGSIPVVASFDTILGLKTVLLGFGAPNENAHSPNEWLSLRHYRTGLETLAHLWDELGRMTARELRA